MSKAVVLLLCVMHARYFTLSIPLILTGFYSCEQEWIMHLRPLTRRVVLFQVASKSLCAVMGNIK